MDSPTGPSHSPLCLLGPAWTLLPDGGGWCSAGMTLASLGPHGQPVCTDQRHSNVMRAAAASGRPAQHGQEHPVGAVPVRPELHRRPVPEVRHPGQQRPGVDQLQARPAGGRSPRRSRPGAASRSRRRPARRAGPAGPRSRAVRRCSSTSSATSDGCRRHLASGRRRSAPSPVQGASSMTRSNDAAGSPGSRPSAVCTVTGRPRTVCRTRSARCGVISTASTSAPRSAASAPSRPALPPGPAARSSQRRVGSGQRGQRRARWRPAASPRPARPPGRPRPPGSRRDRRPRGRPRSGEYSAGSPPDAATSSSRSIRPGPGDQMDGGRLVVGAQARPRSSPSADWAPSASSSALTIHRGCDTAMARWPSGSWLRVGGEPVDPGVQVGLGDPSQHGVDIPCAAGLVAGPDQIDGRRDGGVRRDPGAQDLVGAQPQGVDHHPVQVGDRPVAAGRDHRVQLTEGPAAAVGQFGGQRRVPTGQAALVQDAGQGQVGVGAAGPNRGRAGRARPAGPGSGSGGLRVGGRLRRPAGSALPVPVGLAAGCRPAALPDRGPRRSVMPAPSRRLGPDPARPVGGRPSAADPAGSRRPSRTAVVAGADQHLGLADGQLAGLQIGPLGRAATGPRTIRPQGDRSRRRVPGSPTGSAGRCRPRAPTSRSGHRRR